MVEHLYCLAVSIRNRVQLEPGDLVLDIGSNDGTLLKAFDLPGITLAGMDPSGNKFRQYYPEHAVLIPEFFSATSFRSSFGLKRAKVITSIAMFYDLEDPLAFGRDVSEILADDGIWVFEQSYVRSMLDRTAYDTICHEHLEYYAVRQIAWMAERLDLKIIDITLNDTNGGSFSVTVAKRTSLYPENLQLVADLLALEHSCGLDSNTVYIHFGDRVLRHREALMGSLNGLRKRGERVAGYGASTKGNVLLQFCGITTEHIPYIVEVNPDKFGAFTPGTLIPIISETESRVLAPSVFLVLPWHFRNIIIDKEVSFLAAGGRLLFPLPQVEVFGYATATSANNRS